MPWYEWTRSEPFRDTQNSREVAEGEVVELSAAVADPAYGFVAADPSEDGTTSADADSDNEETAASEYTREELGAMDWQDLRSLAAEADTDVINGKSERAEIVAYFAGDETSN